MADVAAVAVPSEFSEDEVLIVVSDVHGRQVRPAELFRFLEERMAHFMLPTFIRIMVELPKTPTEKICKDILREEGVTEDTWFSGDHGIIVKRQILTD